MKIFLSWSGESSHKLAQALKDWLPSVLPFAEPWVSSEDIRKGRRWSREIEAALEDTSFCIVCVVGDNASSPWINFESGAIAKVIADSHVSPLLLGVEPGVLSGLPLSLFQATRFEKDDVFRLVQAINGTAGSPVPDDRLRKNFKYSWSTLAQEVSRIETTNAEVVETPLVKDQRQLDDLDDKILAYVAVNTDLYPEVDDIVVWSGANAVRTRHRLDKLETDGLVRAHYAAGGPIRYTITEEGRAYVVEHDLVD